MFLSRPRIPAVRSPTPEQQINCAANGVPDGSYVQADEDVAFSSEGGNRELQPEEGSSFDAGIEFRSDGAGWRAKLDYFRTQLDAFIERGTPEIISAECANHGTALACSKIQRFDDGRLRSIDIRQNNLGSVTLNGIDLGAQFDFSARDNQFGLNALVTNLQRFDVQAFEGSEIL